VSHPQTEFLLGATNTQLREGDLNFGLSRFLTVGEQALWSGAGFGPFFRFHDPLCAHILRKGTESGHFECVRLVFPFFRLGSG
jgi:hypothetical protein